MLSRGEVQAYVDAHKQRWVDELSEWCRIPSISADPEHAHHMEANARYLLEGLEALGCTGRLIGPKSHPAVLAHTSMREDRPTLLIYGHHDVQPPDPLDEWETAPFEPHVSQGALVARGSEDDKGQVWIHLKALETLRALTEDCPVNVIYLVEGEEEIGSPHFEELLDVDPILRKADFCIVSDTAFFNKATPSLCVRLRGMAIVEVEVTGPSQDLHSGLFGGAVANPATALARMLAALHDDLAHVTVPHFYDGVRDVTPEDRAMLARLPYDDERFLTEAAGAPATFGEAGYSTLERLWFRPTLEINGMTSGYGGPGSKTIIPATARAKITCRLVPDQDPDHVAHWVEEALIALAPPGVTVHTSVHSGGNPVLAGWDDPLGRACRDAIEEVWGVAPVAAGSGGSVPPVEAIQRVLGIPAVLFGVGLPDASIHAPNEHFDLGQFYRGIEAEISLLQRVAQKEAIHVP